MRASTPWRVVRFFAAQLLATLFVSAFCNSSADRKKDQRMSFVTLKTAPCMRKDLWLRMEIRSNVSIMSIAVVMFSKARASQTEIGANNGMLSFRG